MEYVAEFVGTFVFVSVILFTGNPVAIAVTLLAMIYFTSIASKGSVNPAVSLSLFMKGDLSGKQLGLYIISELAGAAVAAVVFNYVKYKKVFVTAT